jgi:FecR protein
MPRLRAFLLLSLATSLVAPAAFAQNTNTARPGTINYVEGQATLNGRTLTANSHAEMAGGQTVATANGKVEVLLTPGVFLRLGDNSSVTMVSPDLTRTEVQLDRGRAEVEVDQIFSQNDLLVDQGPAQAKLLQRGLYEFDTTTATMRVFDGRAAVSPSQTAKKWIMVKNGHQLALNGEVAKTTDFDREQAANANQDSLYSWSKLRADYLGQANLDLAQEYARRSRILSRLVLGPRPSRVHLATR